MLQLRCKAEGCQRLFRVSRRLAGAILGLTSKDEVRLLICPRCKSVHAYGRGDLSP